MPAQKVETGHQDTVHDVAMDYYGKRLATASSDHTIKIIGVSNSASQHLATLAGHQGPVWQHTDWVRDVAWAPNLGLPKSTIASASQDGKVIMWTVGKEGDQWEGKILSDFKTPVWRVSWSLTGNILAVADGNNNVTLWKEAVDGEWQQVTTVEP
ncbi:hypothetical protein Ahy_A01g004685 isoform A [Arachis hypogaea]|uniref:Uncharacterized protein n=1 Tax=Arachis hypogaea TaxID=3818 RepID=A0A445EWT6_ARAHY|nr:hypothetical protein Ahy_A01g004685 isoform A [Arachis hypogaea]